MIRSIRIYNESKERLPLSDAGIRKLLKKVLPALGKQEFRLSVIAVGDENLREMKLKYFQEDAYTDIISFVISEESYLEAELYCSPERIRSNAKSYGEKYEREFARILIHGACHLCGYEDSDEAERQKMQEMEEHFLTEYFDGQRWILL